MSIALRRHALHVLLASVAALTAMLAYAATQWSLQPATSQLGFIGEQAGAKFEGRFEKFTADIRFDPAALDSSGFDIKIDTASVNTRDGERDDIIRGTDLFNVKGFPQAHYVTEGFTARGGNKFTANGKLTLRGVTRPVPIEFTFEPAAGGAWLKGSARLKRLDFGVGQGDWKDTATVGNDVQVTFALQLKGG